MILIIDEIDSSPQPLGTAACANFFALFWGFSIFFARTESIYLVGYWLISAYFHSGQNLRRFFQSKDKALNSRTVYA